MNQLFGKPNPVNPARRSTDNDNAPTLQGARTTHAPAPEQAFFHVDIKRSLRQHWRLARTVALGFAALAILYVLYQVMLRHSWPMYQADSIVYVQPTPAKVLPSVGGPQRWPYDTNTYETYILQQMTNVSREDVLVSAVHKLDGFQGPGESDQSAAQRFVGALQVSREGDAYQFTISARAGNPDFAAAIANAATAAYIESASRDERTGDTQRLAMLKEEKDRIGAALTADRTEQEALNKQLGVASISATAPDHFDEDITQIRTELVKARTDHDAAEAKFSSLDAGKGPTSAAIDAEADQMIATDAGLISMKTSLNARRAALITQMANLTPVNPQYKQDETELAKINADLDAMMKDLRAKAAARIQLQLRSELQRTGGLESQLNGQLRDLVGSATSATPKLQRSSDLAADISRLQARYAAVDEQMHNITLEDTAPAAAYQVSPAVPPLDRAKTGVFRNAILIAIAGLFFGVFAAVGAQKLDSRLYIAADVERVLGFAPLVQLPDFNQVSEAVAEEYLLRLASAIEHGRKQGQLKNCIFTGTGPETGVSTLVNRVRQMLEAMGQPTVLVDATGNQPPSAAPVPTPPESAKGLVPVERLSRSTTLLQQVTGDPEAQQHNLVLTDTSPLAESAETEYLARFVDCAIVVLESGETTRAQLREAATALQRLNVGAVGFVLNRVSLEDADPAFRLSIEAVEKRQQAQSRYAPQRTERSTTPSASTAPAEPIPSASAPSASRSREVLPQQPTPRQTPATRQIFDAEVAAAAAAAVARFAPHAASSTPPVPVSPAAPPAPSPQAAKTGNIPPAPSDSLAAAAVPAAAVAATAAAVLVEKAVASAPAAPAAPIAAPQPAKPTAPFAEAAQHFFSSIAANPNVPFLPHPVADKPIPDKPIPEKPISDKASSDRAIPDKPVSEKPISDKASSDRAIPDKPVSVKPVSVKPVSVKPVADDLISDKPIAAPVPDAPKVIAAEPSAPAPASEDLPWWLSDAPRNAEPARPPVLWQPAKVSTSRQAQDEPEQWVAAPPPSLQPPADDPAPAPQAVAEPQPAYLASRLSGLRNLLFVLGVKDTKDAQDSNGSHPAVPTNFDYRVERTIAHTPADEASEMRGASPRLVTATPEFLPPKPVVLEFDKTDPRSSEPWARQDRRDPQDRVDILPTRRGQYRKG